LKKMSFPHTPILSKTLNVGYFFVLHSAMKEYIDKKIRFIKINHNHFLNVLCKFKRYFLFANSLKEGAGRKLSFKKVSPRIFIPSIIKIFSSAQRFLLRIL
jgi:hypothetical protein